MFLAGGVAPVEEINARRGTHIPNHLLRHSDRNKREIQ